VSSPTSIHYQLGGLCELRRSDGTWVVATIMGITSKMIQVEYMIDGQVYNKKVAKKGGFICPHPTHIKEDDDMSGEDENMDSTPATPVAAKSSSKVKKSPNKSSGVKHSASEKTLAKKDSNDSANSSASKKSTASTRLEAPIFDFKKGDAIEIKCTDGKWHKGKIIDTGAIKVVVEYWRDAELFKKTVYRTSKHLVPLGTNKKTAFIPQNPLSLSSSDKSTQSLPNEKKSLEAGDLCELKRSDGHWYEAKIISIADGKCQLEYKDEAGDVYQKRVPMKDRYVAKYGTHLFLADVQEQVDVELENDRWVRGSIAEVEPMFYKVVCLDNSNLVEIRVPKDTTKLARANTRIGGAVASAEKSAEEEKYGYAVPEEEEVNQLNNGLVEEVAQPLAEVAADSAAAPANDSGKLIEVAN